MDETLKDWIKAGKIAAEIRGFSKSLVKKDRSVLEITEKIEKKISEKAELAFPVQISLNEIAAHNTASFSEKKTLKEDLVKIDLGVSVDGAIGDTAISVDLGNNKELIRASREALENAIKIIKSGTKLWEIGKEIQETIQSFGFSPIKNLSGHGLNKFVIHDKPTIPNHNNNDNSELKEGQIIAIEPFSTNGVGMIFEGKPSGIYEFNMKKPIRDFNARKLLDHIEKRYKGLPFSKRVLMKEFNPFRTEFSLRILEREKILYQFPQLVEKSKGLVSQAEHTVLVEENGCKILTKSD